MSDSTETIEIETAPAAKATVADRKALAKGAFVVGGEVPAIAALFGNVPNGREYLDVVYSALVTETAMSAVAAGNAATVADELGPIAELRESVEKAMSAAGVKVSTAREVDPVAVRAATVARMAELFAIAEHLSGAAQWVSDLLGDIDPDDLTESEKDIVADVPEKVSALTDRIAALVLKAPRATGGSGDGTRNTVTHTDPTIGTVLQAKGDPTKTATVVAGVDGKVAYDVNGTVHTSISTAAKALAGGERNGWTYFNL